MDLFLMSFSCHGVSGVSNTAGAALWAWITPCLQASLALLGYISIKASVISTISYGVILSEARHRPAHLIADSAYNNTDQFLDGSTLLQPPPPHIQPLYYAAIIAAQFIGSSGSTMIVELTVDNTDIWLLSSWRQRASTRGFHQSECFYDWYSEFCSSHSQFLW